MSSATQKVDGQGNSRHLVFLIMGMVISVAAMVGVFIMEGQKAAFDKAYMGYAAEEQVLSQQIAKYVLEASIGHKDAFHKVVKYRDRFGQTLTYLREGNSATGLPPTTGRIASNELAAVEKTWAAFNKRVDTVLKGKDLILTVKEAASVIGEFMPKLIARYEDVVAVLVKQKASPRQIQIASRQLMLAQRIVNNMNKVLSGENAASAADQFSRDAEEFGNVLEAQIRGGKGIKPIRNKQVQAKLREVAMLFSSVSDYVGEVVDNAEDLLAVQKAAAEAARTSDQLFADALALQNAYAKAPGGRLFTNEVAYGLGGLALFFLVMLGWSMKSAADHRRAIAEQEKAAAENQNRKNQEAILRLLDEIGSLADGDLTQYATVTEDFTGAIADSINYTIDALRDMVKTIEATAEEVSGSAEHTRATSLSLAESSEQQAQEISAAAAAVQRMAASIDEVSGNARESAEVARKSVAIANKGGETVQRSIEGMDTIREQIQETAKRIKRLGESSQEIGDIVELINDIAEQTNILALNAAIQAAMAGEAGRGFAVVADEVQRLAERSGNATKQIEALVKTIQADTNEAVISMEQTTANVVSGAQLAEDAGEALEEIVSVSTDLAAFIENISSSAEQQSAAAASLTDTMQVIEEITNRTTAGTRETAGSIGRLTELAGELRKSVAGFHLPE